VDLTRAYIHSRSSSNTTHHNAHTYNRHNYRLSRFTADEFHFFSFPKFNTNIRWHCSKCVWTHRCGELPGWITKITSMLSRITWEFIISSTVHGWKNGVRLKHLKFYSHSWFNFLVLLTGVVKSEPATNCHVNDKKNLWFWNFFSWDSTVPRTFNLS
jgi:hypothetical protein